MRELSTRQLRALFELVGDDDLEVIERAIRIMTDAVPRRRIDPSASAPGATT